MVADDGNLEDSPVEEEIEQEFGGCCVELKEAMLGEEFEPLIAVGDDDVLYMSVGMVDLDDNEQGMVDHPLFFCPFCGTELQTEEEVIAKVGEDEDEDAAAEDESEDGDESDSDEGEHGGEDQGTHELS